MSECIREHFHTIVSLVEHMEGAEDTKPDGECGIEDFMT